MLNFTIQELTKKETGENLALQRLSDEKINEEIRPQAGREIAPLLAERFGLEVVPPIVKKLAEYGHDLLCPENMVRINIGASSCAHKACAKDIAAKLRARSDFKNTVIVKNTGCMGLCFAEPLVDVRTPDGTHTIFGKVGSDSLWPIINTAKQTSAPKGIWAIFKEKEPGIMTGYQDLTVEKIFNTQFSDYMAVQTKRITRNWGLIDPQSVAEYAATGGYFALAKVLFGLKAPELQRQIAAFCAQHKMDIPLDGEDTIPVLLILMDERNEAAQGALLENDPHSIVESLMLMALALGLKEACILLGPHNTFAAEILQKAVRDALEEGILGEKVLGSDASLHISILNSPDALSSREQTALLPVLEKSGLNNPLIFTLDAVIQIPFVLSQANLMDSRKEKISETRVLYLTGDVKHKGYIEVLPDVSISAAVEKMGGTSSATVKAIQIGQGGEIIPYDQFKSESESEAESNSAASDFSPNIADKTTAETITVLSQSKCIVQIARDYVKYLDNQVCGDCSVCRADLKKLLQGLTALTNGDGDEHVVNDMRTMCQSILTNATCTLGQSTARLIYSTMTDFDQEYTAHMKGKCPAQSCKALIYYVIDQAKCKDCRCCYLVCPAHAITQQENGHYAINTKLCSSCGICVKKCPFGCIRLN